jgi:hypothetical protein
LQRILALASSAIYSWDNLLGIRLWFGFIALPTKKSMHSELIRWRKDNAGLGQLRHNGGISDD